MQIPFTREEFLAVFRQYNTSVWPMQVVFYILGIAALFLAIRKFKDSDRIICAILAFFWLWMGMMYHIVNFSSINKGAYLFGIFYIVQGVLFLVAGVLRNDVSFRFKPTIFSIVGALFLLYSLVIYPLLGNMSGHIYPMKPTFGVPCPTTIFTFGILLWTDKKVPKYILIIPFLWSIIGMSAAVNLGIKEDFGLVIAGVVGTLLIFLKDRNI